MSDQKTPGMLLWELWLGSSVSDRARYYELMNPVDREAWERLALTIADHVPPGAIGSRTWPGLAKLVEEIGELLQVVGKLMAFPSGEHPDGKGPLRFRLRDELGDLIGAVRYFRAHNIVGRNQLEVRAESKFELFQRWHGEVERARSDRER